MNTTEKKCLESFLRQLRALCELHDVHIVIANDEGASLEFAGLPNLHGVEFRGAGPEQAIAWHEDEEAPTTVTAEN